MGLILVAFCAGSQHAMTATATRPNAALKIVHMSRPGAPAIIDPKS